MFNKSFEAYLFLPFKICVFLNSEKNKGDHSSFNIPILKMMMMMSSLKHKKFKYRGRF